jgi:catalase
MHRYRIGPNYLQLPVDRPQCPVSYNRDGAMRYDFAADPVYAPNSAGGPAADEARYPEQGTWDVDGEIVRAPYELHSAGRRLRPGGNARARRHVTGQPRTTSRRTSSVTRRKPDVTAQMKPRIVRYWTSVDRHPGGRGAGSASSPLRRPESIALKRASG